MRNLIWLELFNAALDDIPYQNTGLYLFEGLSWERAFIHAWRKNAHGRLIAVAHSTTRFWDLRLFTDHRTIISTNNFPMPQADLVAITGKAAMGTYQSLGYPQQALEEIEALRYSSLLKIKNNKRETVSKETLRVLILGDSTPYYTNHILELLVKGQKNEGISATYTIKPHPICPVKPSDYLPLNLKIESHPLEDILCDFDLVCSANLTSASVNAYLSGLKVVIVQCQSDLNFSPLRGYPNVSFVNSPTDLTDAFHQVSFKREDVSDVKEFFFLDPELSRWKKLLLPEK